MDGFLTLLSGHVPMSYKSNKVVCKAGVAKNMVLLGQHVTKATIISLQGLKYLRVKIEPQNVCLNLMVVDVDALDVEELVGKVSSICVVFSNLLLPVFEGNEAA